MKYVILLHNRVLGIRSTMQCAIQSIQDTHPGASFRIIREGMDVAVLTVGPLAYEIIGQQEYAYSKTV